jgi:hypothetical protein
MTQMQHEITQPGPLLNADGSLREAGYARRPLLDYDKSAIKAPVKRIKEWDRYMVVDDRFAIELAIADHSYMGVDTVSFFDFSAPAQYNRNVVKFFRKGNKLLSPTSEIGDALSKGDGYSMEFRNGGTQRRLVFSMDRFASGKAISGEIYLDCPPRDSIALATPFHGDPQAFFYNHKIPGMPASGTIRLGKKEYELRLGSSFGTLNWGRGIWTRNNTWLWAGASGLLEGFPFSLNMGGGFGDVSAATENVLFYKGQAHKLAEVQWDIPKKNKKVMYAEPWTISSDDGRVELAFEPVMDRKTKMNLGFVCCDQHQVFGCFKGNVILDDGTLLDVPSLFGFAEKVCNKW